MLKGPKKTVSLCLPEECYCELKKRADDTCRTVPSYIRVIIRNYLRQLDHPETKPTDWWLVR